MSSRNETATLERWRQYVTENGDGEMSRQVKRGEPRVDVFGAAEIETQAEGSVRCSVLEISTHGLMMRSRTRLPPSTAVVVTAYLGDESFALTGSVVHCTQTVGAFKIGIQLDPGDSIG